jgi:hypothetical protein
MHVHMLVQVTQRKHYARARKAKKVGAATTAPDLLHHKHRCTATWLF